MTGKRLVSRAAIVLLLCFFVAGSLALADQTTVDLLKSFGMTQEEAETFSAMLEQSQTPITMTELEAMLGTLSEETAQRTAPGQVADGVYTDPRGFSMLVPDGWTLEQDLVGPTLVMSGPVEDSGLVPTITILITQAPEDSLLDKTQAEIDQVLGAAFPNYLPVALDSFEFQGLPAREMVCTYGPDESSMLVQYQLHFIKDGEAFIITMTTLAEEAAHERALNTYDTFLATFSLTPAQTTVPQTAQPQTTGGSNG